MKFFNENIFISQFTMIWKEINNFLGGNSKRTPSHQQASSFIVITHIFVQLYKLALLASSITSIWSMLTSKIATCDRSIKSGIFSEINNIQLHISLSKILPIELLCSCFSILLIVKENDSITTFPTIRICTQNDAFIHIVEFPKEVCHFFIPDPKRQPFDLDCNIILIMETIWRRLLIGHQWWHLHSLWFTKIALPTWMNCIRVLYGIMSGKWWRIMVPGPAPDIWPIFPILIQMPANPIAIRLIIVASVIVYIFPAAPTIFFQTFVIISASLSFVSKLILLKLIIRCKFLIKWMVLKLFLEARMALDFNQFKVMVAKSAKHTLVGTYFVIVNALRYIVLVLYFYHVLFRVGIDHLFVTK